MPDPVRMTGGRQFALVLLLALVAVGCDPTEAVLVHNTGEHAVLISVRTAPFGGEDSFVEVYELAPGDRIEVGSAGVGSHGTVYQVSILDSDCQVVDTVPVSGFSEGGVVTIGPDGEISMVAGGNPVGDRVGTPTDRCST